MNRNELSTRHQDVLLFCQTVLKARSMGVSQSLMGRLYDWCFREKYNYGEISTLFQLDFLTLEDFKEVMTFVIGDW